MCFSSPFFLGSLELENNIFYAPLAGCSDYPFRRMAKKFRPGLFFCEMVKMEALLRSDANTFSLLDYEATQHPIGAQLCGANPSLAGAAAKIVEDLGFSVVDLNCGCPVDKVTKDGSGSGLLKTPQKIGEILAEMVAAVSIPVTLKIRAGWDEESIVVEELAQIAEQAGAVAMTVHGRTRKQAYRGPADWSLIARAKTAAKKLLLIGNGDLHTPQDVEAMYEQTGCDGFLFARATMGRPWVVEEVRSYFTKGEVFSLTPEEKMDIFLEHVQAIEEYQNEKKALIDLRRVGCWYIDKQEESRKFRHRLAHAASLQEARSLINELV